MLEAVTRFILDIVYGVICFCFVGLAALALGSSSNGSTGIMW